MAAVHQKNRRVEVVTYADEETKEAARDRNLGD
jgi:hypothetical protein